MYVKEKTQHSIAFPLDPEHFLSFSLLQISLQWLAGLS